ncbi:Zinc finger protein 410 [Phytophthora citrophthora]|uniref:Zinc finger protein 410 n=1 Tax=Phytophthora citrophthora TaxID=4793 RepID=A0AAD9GVJ7_9STRA|nr:Zinc finger protein 410 [Phytophthora citrophthora]
MSTSVYQFVSTMTPRFATGVLKPLALSSSSKPFSPFMSFQCGECPRQFSRRYALQEHLATHTGEKAYVCPARNCGKRFTTTSNLARHRRLHGDELQPLCCPAANCTKAFTTSHKLQRHMRVHLGKPARRCKFANCKKTFSSTGNLNRHMRNQHIRFGHPLASEIRKEEQSPTSVDAEPANLFEWGGNSLNTACNVEIPPIGEDLEMDANSEHYVSDEELLEVLSCLLDDDKSMPCKEGSKDADDVPTTPKKTPAIVEV